MMEHVSAAKKFLMCVKYRKYKPLSKPKKCVKCVPKTVKDFNT